MNEELDTLASNGTLKMYNARLISKGFTQKYGVDFQETFSPVVKMTTTRCIIALVVAKQWTLHQLDVNNAFVHGSLDKEVYMVILEGMPNRPNNQACKLRKSLYGLKQASR